MPIVPLDEFIVKSKDRKLLVLDARSEDEFNQAHFPGAINIPLLNNEHRKVIGTCFKKEGRDAAVRLGFKLVGPLFHTFVKKVDELSSEKEVLVYCWRGGMRSGILSWVLNMAGYTTHTLKGGYKSFRHFVLEQFSVSRKYAIVGGHTGTGKTELLTRMKKANHQVIDLEGIACHRGSAFGSLGMKDQPRNEHFENELALELHSLDVGKIIWLEAESRSIGKIKIPDQLFLHLAAAPLFEINMPLQNRVERIKIDYGNFSKTELSECILKLEKRLGGLRMKQALQALEEERTVEWIEILLEYYDKNYSHSLDCRSTNNRFVLEVKDATDFENAIGQIIKLSENIII